MMRWAWRFRELSYARIRSARCAASIPPSPGSSIIINSAGVPRQEAAPAQEAKVNDGEST